MPLYRYSLPSQRCSAAQPGSRRRNLGQRRGGPVRRRHPHRETPLPDRGVVPLALAAHALQNYLPGAFLTSRPFLRDEPGTANLIRRSGAGVAADHRPPIGIIGLASSGRPAGGGSAPRAALPHRGAEIRWDQECSSVAPDEDRWFVMGTCSGHLPGPRSGKCPLQKGRLPIVSGRDSRGLLQLSLSHLPAVTAVAVFGRSTWLSRPTRNGTGSKRLLPGIKDRETSFPAWRLSC